MLQFCFSVSFWRSLCASFSYILAHCSCSIRVQGLCAANVCFCEMGGVASINRLRCKYSCGAFDAPTIREYTIIRNCSMLTIMTNETNIYFFQHIRGWLLPQSFCILSFDALQFNVRTQVVARFQNK